MDYICNYCGKICKNLNALSQHKLWCKKNPDHKKQSSNTDLNDLTTAEKNLLGHYCFLYPVEYKNFYEKNKDKYTGKKLKKYDIARLSKKDTLNDLIKLDEPLQIADGTWACPICGLHIKDMGAHIKSVHNMTWDNFVKEYNWKGSKIYFSETYRNNLSINKLNYYNSPEGLEARKLLSERYSGENNPACKDEVKLKISKSRKGQHMTLKNKQNISKSTTSGLYSINAKSFGYTFWTFEGDKEIRFRSKCEYLIYLMFKHYNMNVEHEPFKIEYFDPSVEYHRHYIVDYVYNNRLFEVKPCEVNFTSDKKYKLIQNTLSKMNKKLEILTPDNFIEVFNISDAEAKPISFFERKLIDNIRNGECRMIFPISNDIEFYKTSKFVNMIGGFDAIKKGGLLYEDKKSNRICK